MQNTSGFDHTESLLENCERITDTEETKSKDALRKNQMCEKENRKEMQLLDFEEAPEYMQHNIFIRSGYRGILNTKLCIERYGQPL